MALGRRISADALLNNRQRAGIVAVLRATPGMHLREAQRATTLPWGEFIYHVRLLQRASIIRMAKMRNRTHLFMAGDPSGAGDRALCANAKHILASVETNGGATAAAIANAVGISRRLARYHIQLLVERKNIVPDDAQPPGYWVIAAAARSKTTQRIEGDARARFSRRRHQARDDPDR